jgi:hypothetical protein
MAANPTIKAGLVAKARSKTATDWQINTTTIPARATISFVLPPMR